MITISFMSANYVARQLNYHMTEGWRQGDEATQAYFRPLITYSRRFDALISEIAGLGFNAVDIWLAHLHYAWATREHIRIARTTLVRHRMAVTSTAGWFGNTRAEFERACWLTREVGAPVMGGNCALLTTDRAWMADTLRHYGLKFGYENHPERSIQEMLDKVGDGDEDVIGFCVDTGWFGTYGVDAVAALRAVGPRLFHVHLKDVVAPGGHRTCQLGTGVVPVVDCVRTLVEMGYKGAISIEHEPEDHNPNEECVASLALVKQVLRESMAIAGTGSQLLVR
jgi:sugar phosphate isomerase/epimerase